LQRVRCVPRVGAGIADVLYDPETRDTASRFRLLVARLLRSCWAFFVLPADPKT
jgi:hypothetical protein